MLVVVRNLKNFQANSITINELVRRLEGNVGPLRGVWCDPNAVFHPEATVTIQCPAGVFRSLRFQQSFELAGIWAVWSFESGFWADVAAHPPSHAALAEALLSQDDARAGRLFIPVFDGEAAPSRVATEMDALIDAHPQRIGAPLYRDRESGRLSWKPMGEAV